MSKTIDERVVEMRFDNKQFESNVQTSLSTLEKLKQKLNFSGASKGLENVEQAAKKCDLTGIAKGIETVQVKFSALSVIAETALSRITNAAITAGKRITSALTIDPIKTGFEEYETKINAIQTIMSNTANKGTTMDDVTQTLDELNTYADKTIYNFAEMTRNIGTFTAAGVGLEESATAIQGIANLAAASGSSSQQASVAMYQLSQALAAGTVKLMDWNSVVNAGMGGEKFQEALKETARRHGVAVDEMIKKNGSFRESLQEGWITADILNETLSNFTVKGAKQYSQSMMESGKWTEKQAKAFVAEARSMEDAATKVKTFTQLWDTLKESAQSGWSQSWEIIVGNFEEAKEVLTGASNIIGDLITSSANARNELLQGGLESGWKQLLGEGIADAEGYKKIVKSVAKDHGVAVNDMIKKNGSFEDSLKEGWLTSDILTESLVKLTKNLRKMSSEELKSKGYTKEQVKQVKELTKGIKDGSISVDELTEKISRLSGRENIVESIKNIFDGIMSVIKPIGEAFRDVFPPATSEQLYNLTEGLREFTSHLKLSDEASESLKQVFSGLFSIVSTGIDLFKGAVKILASLVKLVAPFASSIGGTILYISGVIGKFITQIHDFAKTHNILGSIATAIGNFADRVKNSNIVSGLNSIKGGIQSFISKLADLKKQISKNLPQLKTITGNAFDSIKEKVQGIPEFLSKIKDSIVDLVSKIKEKLSPMGKQIKKSFEGVNIIDIIGTGALGTIAVTLYKQFKKITSSFDDVTENVVKVLDSVRKSLETWQRSIQANTLIRIAVAIGILAAAVMVLQNVDADRLKGGLIGVSVLLADMVAALLVLSKFKIGDTKGLTKASVDIVIMATALTIMAGAMRKLDVFQTWDATWPALLTMSVLMAGLVASARLLSKKVKGADFLKISAGLIMFSYSISQLAKATSKMSQLSIDEVGQGLLTLGVLLGEIALFIRVSHFKELEDCRKVLTRLAASLMMMYGSIFLFGKMDVGVLKQGLGTVTVLLGEMAVVISVMGSINMVGVAKTLTALATSLNLLIVPLEVLGHAKISTLKQGLLSLAVLFGELAIAVKIMSGSEMVGAAGVIIALAAALNLLIIPMEIFGHMDLNTITNGLVGMLGAIVSLSLGLLSFGGVIAILNMFNVSLKEVAITFGIFSASMLGIGAGMAALSLGFATLATIGTAGAVALAGSIVILATSIAAVLPILSSGFAMAIVSFAAVIAKSAPILENAITTMILSACHSLQATVGPIVETLGIIILEAVRALDTYVPQIVEAFVSLLTKVFDVLAAKIPELVASASKMLGNFITAMFEAMGDINPQSTQAVVGAIIVLTGCIKILASAATDIPKAIVSAAAMAGIMVLVAGILAALDMLGVESALSNALALSAVLLAISNVLVTIGGIPVSGAISAIKNIGVMVAGLTGIIAILGALKQIPGFSWLMEQGAEALKQIGNTIGEFIGGIVSGFVTETTSSLPTLGQNLSTFASNAAPFFEIMSNVNDNFFGGISNFATAISKLTDSSLKIGDSTAFVDFGASLCELAPYLVQYSQTASGINQEAITNSVSAVMALANLANSIPSEGGLVSKIVGEKDIGNFGLQLATFGTALKTYSATVTGIDSAAIQNSATAAQGLSNLANSLPNSGGLIGIFAGENDWGTFATGLADFGTALKDYGVAVDGVDSESIVSSVTGAEALVDLLNILPKSGGVAGFFGGDKDLGGFGDGLADFGKSLADFSSSVNGIDTSGVSKVVKMSEDLSKAFKNMSSLDTGSFSNIGSSIQKIVSELSNLDINSFGNLDSSMQKIANTIITSFTRTIDGSSGKVKESASKMISSFINGAKSEMSKVNSTFKSIADGASKSLRDKYHSFYDAGSYLVSGFANGISVNTYRAVAKASAMASAAAAAAKNALKEKSPSRVGYEIGDYFGVGFTNGISDNVSKAGNISADMAENAKIGLSNALSKVSNLLSGDMDFEPTIRPVIDLSDVKSGMGTVNRMFANKKTLTIDTRNVGAISSYVSEIQNGKNDDVISAIENLGKMMSGNTQNTYQVNGITYDDGSNVASAVKSLIRAAKVERRV